MLNPGFMRFPEVLGIKKRGPWPRFLFSDNHLFSIAGTSTGAARKGTFLAGYFSALGTLFGPVSAFGVAARAAWYFVHGIKV
ncbi:hypothetical protein ABH942_003332 [Flavobacterium sp. 28YEA47A]